MTVNQAMKCIKTHDVQELALDKGVCKLRQIPLDNLREQERRSISMLGATKMNYLNKVALPGSAA